MMAEGGPLVRRAGSTTDSLSRSVMFDLEGSVDGLDDEDERGDMFGDYVFGAFLLCRDESSGAPGPHSPRLARCCAEGASFAHWAWRAGWRRRPGSDPPEPGPFAGCL
jgi:hypothetical protein